MDIYADLKIADTWPEGGDIDIPQSIKITVGETARQRLLSMSKIAAGDEYIGSISAVNLPDTTVVLSQADLHCAAPSDPEGEKTRHDQIETTFSSGDLGEIDVFQIQVTSDQVSLSAHNFFTGMDIKTEIPIAVFATDEPQLVITGDAYQLSGGQEMEGNTISDHELQGWVTHMRKLTQHWVKQAVSRDDRQWIYDEDGCVFRLHTHNELFTYLDIEYPGKANASLAQDHGGKHSLVLAAFTSEGTLCRWTQREGGPGNKISLDILIDKEGRGVNLTPQYSKGSVTLAFRGIDQFNRPVFKDVKRKHYYGSVDHLFSYEADKSSVQALLDTKSLRYFGTSFGCEPLGTLPEQELIIDWEYQKDREKHAEAQR
jgi:hypothetical protein